MRRIAALSVLTLLATVLGTAPILAQKAYISNQRSGTVSVIDTVTNTVVGSPITVGNSPYGVAVTPDGSRAYVANSGGTTVSVIATASNTVIATITVGRNPYGVAVSPDGSKVYVASAGNPGSVSVIDTASNTVIGSPIALGNTDPFGVAVSPDGSKVYVTNLLDNTVSVIATASNTVIDTITAGPQTFGIAVTRTAAKSTSRTNS